MPTQSAVPKRVVLKPSKDLESHPPVVAQKRNSLQGVGRSPPVVMPPRLGKPPAKPRTAPVASVTKRGAAKAASLRTRMPYLRPTPSVSALTPNVLADAVGTAASLPRLPPRAHSSGASPHTAMSPYKSSYTAIPEALLQVKKLCYACKEVAEKESCVVVSASTRERRTSHAPTAPSGGSSRNTTEDAAAVIQSIEVVQGMLFSSLQTTTATEALTPLSSRHSAANAQRQRSKSCSQPLESPLISSGSGLFLSRRDRKRAWTLLLHKNTRAILLLVNSARSPLAAKEPAVAAAVLTFLYNVLRHMSGDSQCKAVLLCEKLGLITACTNVLKERGRRVRGDGTSPAARASCLRACEAAGLLFTLVNTFNAKLSATFRLSQSLDFTATCASAAFAFVESEFTAFLFSVQLSTPEYDLATAAAAYENSHSRRTTLKALRELQIRSQWACTAFSHFCFTLFVFTGTPLAAKELGSRGVSLCTRAIAMATFFLGRVVPVLLSSIAYDLPEETLHPTVGVLVALDSTHSAPAWVVKFLRHVELMLLWCVALLHRLASDGKLRKEVAAVAVTQHVVRGCLLFLLPPPVPVLRLVPRRECVHVMLLLCATLLEAERASALRDVADLGGLRAFVSSVLALSEGGAAQWHHYYTQLAIMCGVTMLPALHGRTACYVDDRIPSALRRTPGTTATGEEKAASAPVPLSSPLFAKEQGVEGSADTEEVDSIAISTAADPAPVGQQPSSTLPRGGTGPEGLLLVDLQPHLFSPELEQGQVDALSALTNFAPAQLPWPFTDPAPPTTAEHWRGTRCRVLSAEEDDHLRVPLKAVPAETQVCVLRHHIARLATLDGASCDGGAQPHAHKVVFERPTCAARLTESTACVSPDELHFFADFEGGNLQRAVAVAADTYDLVLCWDTATNSYTQWFHFGLRGFAPGKCYRFNIVNMEKLGSTFNEGQKPLMLHVPSPSSAESASGATASMPLRWQRTGEDIYYFRNTYVRPARAHYFTNEGGTAAKVAGSGAAAGASQSSPSLHSSVSTSAPRLGGHRTPAAPGGARRLLSTGAAAAEDGDGKGEKQRNYFTLTFSVTMPAEGGGTVYLANCFPYSYTELRHHISWLQEKTAAHPTLSLSAQKLCATPGGLEVPLLTITAARRDSGAAFTAEEIHLRPVALLVARVHPGETNASWVMEGLLDALVSPVAEQEVWVAMLCESFVFKVVPMLNTDGVMMGNHRCSFAGMDLNRDYADPKVELNPTLYALKQLLRYWKGVEERPVVMFADFHGHSRAKNFLVYGCTGETMRGVVERNKGERRVRVRQNSTDAPLGPEKFLAALLAHVFPSFSLSQSSYAVTKDKKGSARVVLYDEFGVRMSYGFEATMVGGVVRVPELLQPLSGCEGAPSVSSKAEVHYGPTVYRAMGEAFLRAFAILTEQWHAVVEADYSPETEAGLGTLVMAEGEEEATVLQTLWAATAVAGSGRDAPRLRTTEEMNREPRAGPYASATRCDRRSGPVPVSAAGMQDALRYLFLADRRGSAETEGDGAEVDSESSAGSAAEAGEESAEAEGGAGESGAREAQGGNSSASDSGSDDHDWSGELSSSASVADDIEVDRCSESSMEEEIPTNIFH